MGSEHADMNEDIFQDDKFSAAAMTEKGLLVESTVEQPDVAIDDNVTQVKVRAVDVLIFVENQDSRASNWTIRPSAWCCNSTPVPFCRRYVHYVNTCTVFTLGYTSVIVHTMHIPTPFPHTW